MLHFSQVEAYGMPKDRVETNGFIERLPFAVADRQSVRLDERDEAVRARRSVRGGTENKIEEKIASEAEDMVAQDSKVFRPLFVYRQQMAARQNRKHARKLAHRYHRHANHQSCDHRRSIYWFTYRGCDAKVNVFFRPARAKLDAR